MTTIGYKPLVLFPGWLQQGGEAYVTDIIRRYLCKEVPEVGGGANPTLGPETVREEGISYAISDVDRAS